MIAADHLVTHAQYAHVFRYETKRHVQRDFASTGQRRGTSWTAAGWAIQFRHYHATGGHTVAVKYSHRPSAERFHEVWKRWEK